MNAGRRRLPVVSTLVVALAVAAMVALGVWQLHRARWKDALIARAVTAEGLPPVAWPAAPPPDDRLLFRRATALCASVDHWSVEAGRNRQGEVGWRYIARCAPQGAPLAVDAGWSPRWDARHVWPGGTVTGVVSEAPDGRTLIDDWFGPTRPPSPMIVAEAAAPGLQPSAPPDPRDLPQNHRFYAVQWFAFALLALVIYGLALARRLRQTPAP